MKIQPWKAAVEKLQANTDMLAQDLPDHIDANHMIRSFVDAVLSNPKLANCTMESLLDGVRTAAQLGLVLTPALGHAALVPYGYEARFQPMYKGLMSLAYRSGRVSNISARAVFKGDDFEYLQGTTEYIKHRPGGCSDPEKLTHAYAVAWIVGGDHPVFVVLNREEIERARAMSKAKRDDAPWKIHYAAMAMKTAVIRLSKFIPQDPDDKASVMFAAAVAYDEIGKRGLARAPKRIDVAQLEDVEPAPDDEGLDGELVASGSLDQLADKMERGGTGAIHDDSQEDWGEDGYV